MNGNTRRVRFGFLAVTLAGCLIGASLNAQAPAPAAGNGYKNVQILKDVPPDLMQPTMQFMEISLGVHCVYCHDADGTKRELDTKPQKAIARRMIQMVADLNRTQFNGREVVTCFTCHRGSTKPAAILPYNGEDDPALSTGAAPVPTVDQLLDRYTAALGGAEALAKVPGRTMKGTVANYAHLDEVHPERAPTIVTPVEIVAKADKRMVIQHNINADAVTTYNGATSWARAGAGAATGLRADLLEVAKLETAVIMPTQFKQLLTDLKVDGQEKVGDHTAWVVSGKSQWMPSVHLYFDRDTSYLLSVAYEQKSGYCCHVFRIDYDNFLVRGGVRMPMKWTVNGPRESILVYNFDSAEVGPVEDARFARPAVPAAR